MFLPLLFLILSAAIKKNKNEALGLQNKTEQELVVG